jgi:hypothetical protein
MQCQTVLGDKQYARRQLPDVTQIHARTDTTQQNMVSEFPVKVTVNHGANQRQSQVPNFCLASIS